MEQDMQANVSLYLDGQELELVIQELQKAMLREMKKFLTTKLQFHREWEMFLLSKMEG